MKRLYILGLLISFSYADLSVKQIEQMIEKIHLKREGVSLEALEQTKEPFIHVKEEDNKTVVKIPEKEEAMKLTLHAIMAGKAYINDGWKKVGDHVLGYRIEYIGKKGIVLRNGNTIKTLFLNKSKKNLIMLEERE